MNLFLALISLMVLVPLSGLAQTVGTLTLKEGPVRLIRGVTAFQAAEGTSLRAWDILESSDKGIAQLELPGGSVVALGPSTRVLILGHGAKADQFVLMTGWLKGETNPAAGMTRYVSPQLSTSASDATIILRASPAASDAYFESGSGKITLDSGNVVAAKAGQFFSRKSGKKAIPAGRPDADFLNDMPVAFRDTLPSRLARFPKPVEPKAEREVNYADVEAWLRFGPWRQSFVERFTPRLKDAAFRAEIEKHLKELPEWDDALHPEDKDQNAPTAQSHDAVPEKR
jgi:hypothetical protein